MKIPYNTFSFIVVLHLFVFLLKFVSTKVAVENANALASLKVLFKENEINHCKCFILYDSPSTAMISLLSFVSLSAALCQPAGNFLVKVTDRNFSSLNLFLQSVDVSKTRPACTLGFIYIFNKSSLTNMSKLFSFLQNLHGIVKTDQDMFVFVSNETQHVDSMLVSNSFGLRFKFAIGLNLNDDLQIQKAPWARKALFYDRTKNLQGKLLTISTPTSTRWLNEMYTLDGKWIPKRGIYSIALNQLKAKYNFTTKFIPSTGGGTGGKVNKTIWVGTVGDVLNRRADIGHVTAATLQRYIVVDSAFPISYEWLTFTTGKAPEFHPWQNIYLPFNASVWQLTAVISVLIVALFKIVLKLTHQDSPITKVMEYMLAVVTEEGVKDPEQYPTHSLRVTMVLWLLFSLLMGTAYRSKLTAFLAFPHVEHLPESFEALAASKYSIGLQYIKGAAYQILKSSRNPTYVSIFKRMELEESDVKCFKRAINEKFACISWDSMADYVYHKNLTDKYGHAPVVKSPASSCFLTAGMVLEKRSILKASFDYFLIWAMDTGMMNKWRQMDHDYVAVQRKHWERETSQPEIDYNPSQNTAIGFSHLSGGYYMFGVGIFTSIISFLVEILYIQYRKCMGWENIEIKNGKSSAHNNAPYSNSIDSSHNFKVLFKPKRSLSTLNLKN